MRNRGLAKFDSAAHTEQLIEEFLKETGGSYDVRLFEEWYRKRLYSDEGLKMLNNQTSQGS